MPSTNWTLTDDQTLAEYVKLEDFKSLSQERIGISPDHVALLMRDGEIVDAFSGGHFAIGGVWQRMKDLLGGKHSLRLLVATLKPFMIEGKIEGVTKDNLQIAATVAVEFQVNPEKPANILGLMKERDALTKVDVYDRLAPHLKDRVFSAIINKVGATEIRGNDLLQDKIQAQVMTEVDRLFKDLGVMVRAVSLSWGTNDVERAEIERANSEREQQMLDFQAARTKRELTREREISAFVLQSDLQAEKLKASSEDELKHMFLNQELNFIDAKTEGVRAQELKKLEHDLAVLNISRANSYKVTIENALNETERAAARKALTKIELEIEAMKADHGLDIDWKKAEQGIRLDKLGKTSELDVAAKAHEVQMKTLADLERLEGDKEKRQWEINREKIVLEQETGLKGKELDRLAELERLRAQGQMSPDQLLALAAAQSPDVARIFSDRAKAEGSDFEKREALYRERTQDLKDSIAATREQDRFFAEKMVQTGQTAGGRSTPRQDEPVKSGDENDTVECSKCRNRVPVRDRFCKQCGNPMRT